MAVERVQGRLQFARQVPGVERCAAASLRHLLADVLPEVPEHRHLGTRHVVHNRHPRQLDDAALDGVHQREIADRPGKERALRIAGAAQKEGRGGKVDRAFHTQLALHGVEAGYPHPGRFAVALGFLAVVAGQLALVALPRFLAIAVVGFIVED